MTKLTEYIREIDVLEQWPMSRYTLLRARRNGLPFVRLGAFVCYRPEDLEAWFLAEPKRRGKRRRGAAKLADSEKEGGMESDAS